MAAETWSGYREKKYLYPSPLEGIRVLELCTLILGPAGPGFLASMGAEVIKCELPPVSLRAARRQPVSRQLLTRRPPESQQFLLFINRRLPAENCEQPQSSHKVNNPIKIMTFVRFL